MCPFYKGRSICQCFTSHEGGYWLPCREKEIVFIISIFVFMHLFFLNNVVTDVVNRMLVIEFFFLLCQLHHSRALYAVKQNARNHRVHIAPHHGEVIVVLRLN